MRKNRISTDFQDVIKDLEKYDVVGLTLHTGKHIFYTWKIEEREMYKEEREMYKVEFQYTIK
ncbi:MAG: hypothetical protein PWP15_1132 [Methanothermococcus sp.]|uniref:hypothetical protein n=1 Tax=Methanothermococcus sp. TaxID=2614238 RepID=UPI002588249D|nr:hypothetical protein [Methanothermococcus sp.]MDK2790625.1 hypothetical protein [Methanothermococcus sp.]